MLHLILRGRGWTIYLNKETQKLDNDNMAILKSFPNVILSPHMAFYTEQAVSDMVENSIRGILGLENGELDPEEYLPKFYTGSARGWY